MRIRLRYPLLLLVILACGYAGNADFDDALAEEQRYIERVCDGAHSDYLSLGVTCAEVSRPLP
jgi:hypothetical protein